MTFTLPYSVLFQVPQVFLDIIYYLIKKKKIYIYIKNVYIIFLLL